MPRCKTCKQKFVAKQFNQKNCFENDECIKAEIDLKTKAKKKLEDKKFKEMEERVKTPVRKNDLQKEINKLSRMIDKKFNYKCIDCDNPFGKQTDAAHLHNVGGHQNIRFNLHNLHSARSHCNKYNSEHKVGYRQGIIKRYGDDYLYYISEEMPKECKYLGLLDNEVKEKLAIVRKLIRDFDTFDLKDGKQARYMFNKIIGIYEA
jgi:hypothetical protein